MRWSAASSADDAPDPRFGGALSRNAAGADDGDLQPHGWHLRVAGLHGKDRRATSESIEVESSHCGMGHHPAVVYAVADRLAQPEGDWKPFDRGGWRSLVYPDPHR